MILTTYYKTDLNYGFNMLLVSLSFSSERTLSLKELIDNNYLPVEIINSYIEGNKLNYCNQKELTPRKLNIETNDGIIFTIDCPIPFRDIDFISLEERNLKVVTIGEIIKDNLTKIIISKANGI